ncbi:MAG: PadR family transcriptional regulator [Candidatus Bathyarchaeia archaeon]
MQSHDEVTAGHWLKETRKGYIRIAVLILLSKKPHHGYAIMREIKERTGGFWKPTAGGIYPILQKLEKSEYIEGKWDSRQKRKRKTYRITETGRPVLQQALARQNQIADGMSNLFSEFMKDVLDVKSSPRRPMPNLFSVFLEERKQRPEDTNSVLKLKRGQIGDAIEALQKELDDINKRLAKMEPQKKRTSRRRLN